MNGGTATADWEDGEAEGDEDLHFLPAAKTLHLHFLQRSPFDRSVFLHLLP